MSLNFTTKSSVKCRKYKSFYPSLTPIIYGFSTYSSAKNTYTVVYVTGTNFLPDGTTTVQFGSYTNLPVVYYGSFNISFVVPIPLTPATYKVYVTNNTNSNFNTGLLYSSPVTYTITS
jgi:hypothetical protein